MSAPVLISQQPEFTTQEAAHVFYMKLPSDIVAYYDNVFLRRQDNQDALLEIIEDWLVNKRVMLQNMTIENDLALENLICYVIDTNQTSYGCETECYKFARKNSINRKYYLIKKIREEMGVMEETGGNPNFIEKSYRYYVGGMRPGSNEKILTKNEYEDAEYEKAEAWYNDSESFLIQFPYIEMLSAKRRANCLIADLTLFIYRLIKVNYYNNSFGYVTKTPDVAFGIPDAKFINWAKTSLNLKIEASENMVQVYEEYEFDKAGSVRMIIDEVPVDCSTEEKKRAAISRIEKEYHSGARVRALDTIDFSIYTTVLNSMNLDVIASGEAIKIPFKDFVRSLCKGRASIRAKDYSDTFTRLNKLARMKISTTSQDTDGKVVAGSVISFFDLAYRLNGENEAVQKVINISGSGRIQKTNFSARDFDGMDIEIIPHKFMTDQWKSIHSYVVSESYQQITSTKGKLLLQILQEKCMQIYPEREITLPISFFKDKFYFAKRDSRFKNEVEEELDNLKLNNVLIESFKVGGKDVRISFLPLTKLETAIFFKQATGV